MKDKGYIAKALSAVTGRPLEETLRELYVEKRHSQQEIADALGVSRDSVNRWLKDYSISRDERPPVVIEPVQA